MKGSMEHILHSVILGVVLYLGMVYGLGQSQEMACSRSTVIAAVALIYMVMYGHSFPPGKINSALGF
jgi:hypothetical protein